MRPLSCFFSMALAASVFVVSVTRQEADTFRPVVRGRRGAVAASTPTTVGAAAGWIVAASLVQARLGQFGNAADALGDIRHVLAWPVHGSSLLTQPPLYLHFTPDPT